jgi:hypothetical protein
MIKFFRKIRQKTLSENKFGKYLTYAIGEIILVVIGIILALQINTWNNERTAKKELKEIYKQIQKDLVSDTLQIDFIVNKYNEKDKRIQNILDKKIKLSFYDTISSANFKDCAICITESTSFYPVTIKTKGYNFLKTNGIINVISKNPLPDLIDTFYMNTLPSVDEGIKDVSELTSENIKDMIPYSWYVDWVENNYNADFLTYIFTSESYRKQLATYRLFYGQNYISRLKHHSKSAKRILNLIELELKK